MAYSGKTVEINNTDAEVVNGSKYLTIVDCFVKGRIILADGVCFACKNFDPDYIIDVATLTGVHTIATVSRNK